MPERHGNDVSKSNPAPFRGSVAKPATVPPHLRAPELSAQEAERKQITVMFADLCGFTALSEASDAEDVRNLINACFESIGEVVARYGGFIDKFIGDEIMILFGAPVAIEDHASRSLHAAAAMRDTLEHFNASHALTGEQRLSMHFGINSGHVVAGMMGTTDRRQYTVMGDAVNIAARLAARAGDGEILTGEATRHLVGEGFSFEELGEVALEGRVKQTRIYRLTYAAPPATSARAVINVGGRMLGRDAELRALQELFREVVVRRQPRSAAIIGPAGIGKSRLQREFRRWLERAHPETRLLYGGALPHMTAAPYFIISELIKNWLGVTEADNAAHVRELLARALDDLGINGEQALYALSSLIGVASAGVAETELSPEELRHQTFVTCSDLLRRVASRDPLILVFEDLHWVDDQTMGLLEFVFAELAEAPILFLTLTRPEASASALQAESRLPKEAHRRIFLAELDAAVSSQLVAEIAPGIERSRNVVETITQKSQGNPFFIEGIVGMLTDQGVIRREPGGSYTAPDITRVSVPDNVWGVVAERIDRLPAEQRHTIQRAAIVGRTFWEGLVAELTAADAGEHLRELEGRELINRLGPAGFGDDWEWMFRHVLVQEVAYSGLLREVRREGHLVAARWIEERVGDRRTEFATLLAHHYAHGEDWAKAAEFADRAGDRAAELFAMREARVLYVNALDALVRLPASFEHARARIDVTLKLAHVALWAPTDEVLSAIEAGLTLAAEIQDEERRVRLIARKAAWLYVSGRTRPSVEVALQAVSAGTELGLEELLAIPYTILGRAMLAMGEYERCVEMMERAISLAEQYRIELHDPSNLSYLGMAYQALGHLEKGDAVLAESMRIGEEKHDLRRIAATHTGMGAMSCSFGRLKGAGGHLQQAVTIFEETDDQVAMYVTLGYLGHWHQLNGDLDRGQECVDRALSVAAGLDSLLFVPDLKAIRAEIDIKRGNLTAAIATAEEAVALGAQTRQQTLEANAHCTLAWAYYHAYPDAHEAPEREFRTALEIHTRTHARVHWTAVMYHLAAFLDLTGRADEATVVRDEAERTATELRLDWLPTPPPRPAVAVSPV